MKQFNYATACLLPVLFNICLLAGAADPKYPVSEIPKQLLRDAKAVIRNRKEIFEIKDYNTASLKVEYVITILNKNGIENSIFNEFYNSFSTVSNITAKVYDQYGKSIRTGYDTRVEDYAALSGYSLFEDQRVKVFDPKYATTPFTIEYSYEIEYHGLLGYPSWTPIEDYNISVEKSDLRVVTPVGFKFRYLEKNIQQPCQNGVLPRKTTYHWEARNLNAVKDEAYSPSAVEFLPIVYLAPNDFEIGGARGNCESWTNLGQWIIKLNEGRNKLNEDVQKKIKDLVAGTDNDVEKVKLVYDFFQNKVRYVSVQVGLGGWQPIEAALVDKYSYGDCKALSNYMKSLLDIINIKSYYTIIYAGESAPSQMTDFPQNRFNHAILCVPVSNDTIWLECTDQKIPFGFLGTFTDDRKALVITEKGGILTRTKTYGINDNCRVRKAEIAIDNEGNAQTKVHTVYKGLTYDGISSVLRLDDTDKKKFINEKLGLQRCDLEGFDYSEERNIIPSLKEDLKLYIENYGMVMGQKMVFRANLISRPELMPVRTMQRNSPVMIRRSYCESDTIVYSFKNRFKPAKNTEFSLVTPFGEYKNEYILKEDKLTYIRSFKLYKGTFPKEEYESFVEFFEKVQNEDSKQIALEKII